MNTLIDTLKKQGARHSYRAGDWLFQAGDPANGLFLIEKGEVRIYRMDEEGREVELVRLGPGDFFGEAILFVQPVFPAFASVVKPSQVFFLGKERLFQALKSSAELAHDLLTLLAQKCVVLNRRIEALGLKTVRQRLVRYLLSRCRGENTCTVNLDMKKSELAQLLGTISETLSRNLKQLQDDGLIRVQGRSLHIPDCRRLKDEIP